MCFALRVPAELPPVIGSWHSFYARVRFVSNIPKQSFYQRRTGSKTPQSALAAFLQQNCSQLTPHCIHRAIPWPVRFGTQ